MYFIFIYNYSIDKIVIIVKVNFMKCSNSDLMLMKLKNRVFKILLILLKIYYVLKMKFKVCCIVCYKYVLVCFLNIIGKIIVLENYYLFDLNCNKVM